MIVLGKIYTESKNTGVNFFPFNNIYYQKLSKTPESPLILLIFSPHFFFSVYQIASLFLSTGGQAFIVRLLVFTSCLWFCMTFEGRSGTGKVCPVCCNFGDLDLATFADGNFATFGNV